MNEISSDAAADESKQRSSKYGTRTKRGGGAKRTDGSNMPQKPRKYWSIRIDNLNESTTQKDLEELIKPFGLVQKRYLAIDKDTNLCQGFAYVHFKSKNDASQAMSTLDGYGYDNCILSVDWSYRSTNQ